MTTKPPFIMPAKPGDRERQLLALAQKGAERDLTAQEIAGIVKLIKSGADLSAYDEDSRRIVFENLIHAAIQSEEVAHLPQYMGQKLLGEIYHVTPDLAGIHQLIDGGADVNQRDLYRRSALVLAAMDGRTEVAKRLIGAGADIDAQDRDGDTALILAARNENKELVQLLLERGARQDLCTTYGHSALIAAVTPGIDGALKPKRMEIARMLVAHGADPAEKIDGDKSATERLQGSGHADEAARLTAAAEDYRRGLLEPLRRKKPGDKFKLKPRSPQ